MINMEEGQLQEGLTNLDINNVHFNELDIYWV